MLSQRNYGFLITKELIFGFQILDLKVHFTASLSNFMVFENDSDENERMTLRMTLTTLNLAYRLLNEPFLILMRYSLSLLKLEKPRINNL